MCTCGWGCARGSVYVWVGMCTRGCVCVVAWGWRGISSGFRRKGAGHPGRGDETYVAIPVFLENRKWCRFSSSPDSLRTTLVGVLPHFVATVGPGREYGRTRHVLSLRDSGRSCVPSVRLPDLPYPLFHRYHGHECVVPHRMFRPRHVEVFTVPGPGCGPSPADPPPGCTPIPSDRRTGPG